MSDELQPLTHRVASFVRSQPTGSGLTQIQEAFPDVDPREVRAALQTLRHQHVLTAGMQEGELVYRDPATIAQRMPGTALRTIPQGRGGEGKPRGPAAPAEAGEQPAAPRAPRRAPQKTARAEEPRATTITEGDEPMGRKRQAGAIERVVLEAIGASDGDLHAHADVQQRANGKGEHKLTAGQVRKAIKRLRAAGLVEAVGRGRGVQHRITDAGKAALASGEMPAATEKPATARRRKVKATRKASKPRGRRAKASSARRAPYRGMTPEAESAADRPVASFTAKGEVLVSRGANTKRLDVDESREVIALVRAFDGAGLLPRESA